MQGSEVRAKTAAPQSCLTRYLALMSQVTPGCHSHRNDSHPGHHPTPCSPFELGTSTEIAPRGSTRPSNWPCSPTDESAGIFGHCRLSGYSTRSCQEAGMPGMQVRGLPACTPLPPRPREVWKVKVTMFSKGLRMTGACEDGDRGGFFQAACTASHPTHTHPCSRSRCWEPWAPVTGKKPLIRQTATV